MKGKRILVIVVMLMLSSLIPLGVVRSAPVRVNVSIGLDPKTLDPTLVYCSTSSRIVNQLFLPLVRIDTESMRPIPVLAKSWNVSRDGLTWTFYLRNDVKWTDGRSVTAHDVEYGFRRILNPKAACPFASTFYMVKNARDVNTGKSANLESVGVKAVDNFTVRFTLEHPAAYFLSALATVNPAVPSWTIEKYGESWTDPKYIVTNGPYKLKSWAHYDEIILVKNPGYYNAQNVQIEEAHYLYVLDASTALSMYLAGDLDTVDVPGVDMDRVKADPKLSKEFRNGPMAIIATTQINSSYPPFDNPLVRKAFAAAIDKETLIKYVLKGGQQPAYTVTPPGCLGHVAEGVGIPFDPATAKKYLEQAGYPGGKGLPEVSYAFGSSDVNHQVAQALQMMWKQNLGVDVKLKSMEERVYWSSVCEGAHQMWRMGNSLSYLDANRLHYGIFHSEYGERNLRWKNDEYNRIVEEASVEQDPAKREAIYRRAEEILVEEECALIPMYYYAFNMLTKPYLERTYPPDGRFLLEEWRVRR